MRQQEYLGKINGHIEEVYSGHTIVKAYNAEEQMDNKFRALNSTLKNSTFKAQFLSGLMMPIMTFVFNIIIKEPKNKHIALINVPTL